MSNKLEKSIEELLAETLVPEDEKPYKVPDNWLWVRFGTVVKLINGYAFKSDAYIEEGVPVIRISDINPRKTTSQKAIRVPKSLYNKKFIIKRGDLLIAMSGATTGKTGIYESDEIAMQNQRVGNIKEINQNLLHRGYKNYFVINSTDEILKLAYGGAQPNISGKLIESMKFPLPPLNEQKRIADKVERLLDKINQAKQLIEEAKETFELRRAAILDKAFRGELTARWRKQHGLGMDSWEETTLQEHTSKLGDGIHGTPKYSDEGEFYFINGNNLDGYSIVIKPNTKRVDIEEYNKHKKNLSSQTVFVSINGTLGKTAFYNGEPIILGKSACYFNVKDTLDKRFIRYYLLTQEFHNYAQTMATGSTIKNLSLKAMRNLPLKVSSLSEQQEIVRLLDNLFDKEDRMIEICDVNEKIDLIIKAVLNQAFRGELGTNDAAEESAMNLLEDILKNNN
jgi:type I restriction enzyme S subunit